MGGVCDVSLLVGKHQPSYPSRYLSCKALITSLNLGLRKVNLRFSFRYSKDLGTEKVRRSDIWKSEIFNPHILSVGECVHTHLYFFRNDKRWTDEKFNR